MKLTVLLLSLVSLKKTEGAVAVGISAVSEEHPGKCLDDRTGAAYSVSEVWEMRDTCGQHTCVKRGDTLYINYETCGSVQADPPCYTVQDMSLPYPACCPRIICNKPIANEINIDEYSDYSLSDRLSAPVADYVNYDVVLPQDSALQSLDRVSVSAPVADYVNYDVVLPQDSALQSLDRVSVGAPVADSVNYNVVLPQDSALQSLDRVSVSAPVADYVNYDVVLPQDSAVQSPDYLLPWDTLFAKFSMSF